LNDSEPQNQGETKKILAEYALPIITAVIGSSLLLSIVTVVISEFNKPIINIYVERHNSLLNNAAKLSEPDKNYYEVIARNNGRTPATNLKLSMFFFAEINEDHPPEVMLSDHEPQFIPNTSEFEPSIVTVQADNLTQNEIIVTRVWYDWNDARKYDPYYISATYVEGGSHYPAFRPENIDTGLLPNIVIGQDNTATSDRILIASSVISIIAFSAAILHHKLKAIKKTGWKQFDLSSAIPLAVLAAIFVFYCCESLPRALLVPTIIPIPIDVRNGPSTSDLVTYEGIPYSQGELLIRAAIFVGASAVARTIVSYVLAKRIIVLRIKDQDQKSRTKKIKDKTHHLWSYSFFIMGIPLSSIFILFFSESLYASSTSSTVYFFTVFFLIDIIRMLVLVFVTPLIALKPGSYYYILSSISSLSGVLNFIFYALTLRIVSDSPSDINITGQSATAYFGPNSTFFGLNTETLGNTSEFLVHVLAIYFLLFGCIQIGRVAILWRLNRYKEKKVQSNQNNTKPEQQEQHKTRTTPKIFWIPAVSLSTLVMVSWAFVIYYITSTVNEIGHVTAIISVGIITILLEAGYFIATIADKLAEKSDPDKEAEKSDPDKEAEHRIMEVEAARRELRRKYIEELQRLRLSLRKAAKDDL
jgi:hypothetical protein